MENKLSDSGAAPPGINPNAPPPIVHGEAVELSPGVFIIPDGRVPLVPNVGIIVGDRAVLVIECGLGPRSGEIVLSAAKKLASGKPIYLTLTHFHPEHGFGAQAFKNETILYNRQQHEEFREKAAGYLSQFRGFGPAVADALQDVEFVDPHIIYDGNCDLDLGGKTVQLRSWGAAHSRGDQIIYLPDEGIVFTGDLVESRFYPIFPYFPPYDTDIDPDRWLKILDSLRQLAPATIVPGHGEIGVVKLLDITTSYIEQLRTETAHLSAEDLNENAIISRLTSELKTRHPDWDESEPWRIATAVQTFLGEKK